MRIVIGLTDIGNIAATYAKAFRTLGHEPYTIVWSKRQFFPDSQYDLVIYQKRGDGLAGQLESGLGMVARLFRMVRAVNADIFIFFAPAVLPSYLYYPLLKLAGKQLITVFWGSDVRYWYAFQEEARVHGVLDQLAPFVMYARERSGASYWDKLRTIQTAEKYSDLILAQPDSGQLQTRPYMRTHVPLDLSLLKCEIPDREVPLIVHAPSTPSAKGTDHILAALDQLKREGIRFEFKFIENMPNPQLRELLTRADIVVDELYARTVGGLSAEAMASGCAVLVRYDAEYSRVPSGCPALNTNKYTLLQNLREVIVNRELRRRLAEAGRPYVEAHNDHVHVARQILERLNDASTQNYDFVPTYYQEFKMPPELLEQEKQETWMRRKQLLNLIVRTGGTHKG